MARRRYSRRRYRPRARKYTLTRRRFDEGGIIRRLAPTRLPRGMITGVHHFKRTFQGSGISAAAAGNVLGALTFKFNQIPNYTEFTNLFDEYRINMIKVEFVPNFTGSDVNPATTAVAVPNFHTVIDHDSAASPANLDELLQYPNYKRTRGQSIHKRIWRPTVTLDVEGTVSASAKFKQWINCALPALDHYGIKYFVDQVTGGNICTWRTYTTLYFSCRGVR